MTHADIASIAVLALDDEPDVKVLEEIRAIPLVTKVYAVKLPSVDALPDWMG
jgi:hypothetical protein